MSLLWRNGEKSGGQYSTVTIDGSLARKKLGPDCFKRQPSGDNSRGEWLRYYFSRMQGPGEIIVRRVIHDHPDFPSIKAIKIGSQSTDWANLESDQSFDHLLREVASQKGLREVELTMDALPKTSFTRYPLVSAILTAPKSEVVQGLANYFDFLSEMARVGLWQIDKPSPALVRNGDQGVKFVAYDFGSLAVLPGSDNSVGAKLMLDTLEIPGPSSESHSPRALLTVSQNKVLGPLISIMSDSLLDTITGKPVEDLVRQHIENFVELFPEYSDLGNIFKSLIKSEGVVDGNPLELVAFINRLKSEIGSLLPSSGVDTNYAPIPWDTLLPMSPEQLNDYGRGEVEKVRKQFVECDAEQLTDTLTRLTNDIRKKGEFYRHIVELKRLHLVINSLEHIYPDGKIGIGISDIQVQLADLVSPDIAFLYWPTSNELAQALQDHSLVESIKMYKSTLITSGLFTANDRGLSDLDENMPNNLEELHRSWLAKCSEMKVDHL